MSFIQRCKEKWGIDSTRRVVVILLVFSITGLFIVEARKLVFALFGYTDETSTWLKAVTYLALCFPLYQVSLLFFATLLGEFHFFWEKEKKLVHFIVHKVRKLF